ncbi:hypothetical protein ACF0H5_010135 [Mactra antiquata]
MSSLRLIDLTLGQFWKGTHRIWKKDKRIAVILGTIFLVCGYYFYQSVTMPVRFLFINKNIDKQCIIPDLDPFDKSIMKYVWSPDPIHCDSLPDLVYVDDAGSLQYNRSAFKVYNVQDIKCSYSPLIRPNNDDYSVTFGDEKFIDIPYQVPTDFFKFRCYTKPEGKMIYETLQESVYVTESMRNSKAFEDPDLSKYSIFMFGIDSTSRLSFIRKLPKTYKYVTETLGAYIFKGYMKVGDNTFPNVVPILTGKLPGTEDLPNPAGTKYNINKLPFVWQNFSREQYATVYAEDYPIVAAFNTDGSGFLEPPTDHYLRPWMLGLRKINFVSDVLKSVLLPFEYKNINLKKTSSLCFGNKPIFTHQINYLKRFVTLYSSKLRFVFSWLVQICHEFVNYLELGDEDFYQFFKFLKDNGHLDNAFLIFFSDHGSRIDDIRNTFVGRIEERMPVVTIAPPQSFKQKYPAAIKNLLDNTRRLTSNFDLHETVNDILTGDFEGKLKFQLNSKRGISLFQPIPESRSCADASIPEHFCACYGSTDISTKEPLVVKASKFAITYLNNLLKKYTHICAELMLLKIHEAQLVSLGLSAQGEEENRWTIYKFFSKPEAEKHKRFLIIFETIPGNAMFEATVDYHVETGMEITDDISRTNKYGNTSICVPEKTLQKYCYCKTMLKQ